jgi:ribosomal protein L11 methylase PrmA
MTRLDSSFRDPSGFLFERDGVLYRQVNLPYKEEYDQLASPGGLFEQLIDADLLIRHEEVSAPEEQEGAYKILRPRRIPFVSYPYEWSFSQLKDAALLTLELQRKALESGMSLKDASAYNVQFRGCKPVFIDTLSWEPYREGEPWVAYRQFCQHFLGPLALMAHRETRLNKLLRTSIDGIPLDLTSRLLPRRSWLRFGILSHIHLHASAQRKHAASGAAASSPKKGSLSRTRLLALLDNLEGTVRGLKIKASTTEWGDYYDQTNYSSDAFEAKRRLVQELTRQADPVSIMDLGANTGVFTRAALEIASRAERETYAVACDVDEVAVEKNYVEGRQRGEVSLLPLVMDLTNPSPGVGWHHGERSSLVDRGPFDLVMSLALIHHLAISNNVPLERIASFFREMGRRLIVEFVPKSDSQVKRLLATREDIFPEYEQQSFEDVFRRQFSIERSENIPGSERQLYLMTAK